MVGDCFKVDVIVLFFFGFRRIIFFIICEVFLEGLGIKFIKFLLDLNFRNDVRGGFIFVELEFFYGFDFRFFFNFIYF